MNCGTSRHRHSEGVSSTELASSQKTQFSPLAVHYIYGTKHLVSFYGGTQAEMAAVLRAAVVELCKSSGQEPLGHGPCETK